VNWLEKNGYILYVYPAYDKKMLWKFNIWFDNNAMFLGQILEYDDDKMYDSREEATDAGIKYCLEKLL
jgi:hypothetical protein